ncbi:ABC transporter permease [Brachybacterium sp. AOP43-C2-M15]|uniref:ABC transporter permease n=1 Tax=Brachybacterium sp. AOP43-C2-M15 TaxID=3457661 RepID=UPI004033F124
MSIAPPRARRSESVTHLGARGTIRAVLACALQAWRAQFVFRAATWSGIIGTTLQVVLVLLVWTAVYGARTEVAGVAQHDAITYAVLGAVIATVFQPFVYDTLYGRLRTGAIAFDVMRPLSAVPMTLAQQVGAAAAQLPAAAVAVTVGLLLGALGAPGSVLSALAFTLSIVLGFAIAQILNFMIGLVGFWTLEVSGAFHIYRMFVQFSSGALIPLWFMPEWLSGGLSLLPFSSQVFVPLTIYVDASPGAHTLAAIGLQLVWILVLTVLAVLLWRRAIRRLVIFGG